MDQISVLLGDVQVRSAFVYLTIVMAAFGWLTSCSKEEVKDDYILAKEVNSNNIRTLTVVQYITLKEAKTRWLSDFMRKSDYDNEMCYHINDTALYDGLTVGERVKAQGYMILWNPPQEVADEIIRPKDRED